MNGRESIGIVVVVGMLFGFVVYICGFGIWKAEIEVVMEDLDVKQMGRSHWWWAFAEAAATGLALNWNS